MPFFWMVTILSTCFAAFVFVASILGAKGAPQEAAGAAIALCLAVIPYVFTRALEALSVARWREQMLLKSDREGQNLKEGVESLWKQLDVIRQQLARPVDTVSSAATGPASLPPTSMPSIPAIPGVAGGMGYCAGCGKLRHSSVTSCVYCKDTRPVVEAPPQRSWQKADEIEETLEKNRRR